MSSLLNKKTKKRAKSQQLKGKSWKLIAGRQEEADASHKSPIKQMAYAGLSVTKDT